MTILSSRWGRAFAPLLILLITVALWFAVGCNDSDYHKAADASAKISSSLGAMTTETINLEAAGTITIDESRAVLVEIDHAVVLNQQFREQLVTFKASNPQTRAALASYFAQLTQEVNTLSDSGVLHIKNPESQAKLKTYVVALRASIEIIASVVGATSQSAIEEPNLYRLQAAVWLRPRDRPQVFCGML